MCQRSCGPPGVDQVCEAAKSLEDKFTAFAKSLEPKGEGRTLTPEAVKDWLNRAGVSAQKGLSEAELKAAVDKLGSKISLDQVETLLKDLATSANTSVSELKDKLVKVTPPK